MAASSTGTLVDALRQYRLLEPAQLQDVSRTLQSRFPDPKALAADLIRRGWLTPFQANQLLMGRGGELVLGTYVLLERLGEGGMGQVFKARHRNLARIVALKVIRKERLDNPDAVRRFEREVRSAAALAHPNIVLAYDADQIGGTHLLVMEYVEGATDLAWLVKKHGPLPVPQACEYIKQVALGLQHAYGRGMVHRDIKPANLLLTADRRIVKILDMGLARLDESSVHGEASSTMTHEGAVMGTPDYIAPEQAVESHTVDIRADLYSLGCTFYYLLAGHAPFPTGSFLQKINKHQFEEPQAVERLRPDVPPGVARVVRKLLEKKPENRYQAPVEVVAALNMGGNNESEDSGTAALRQAAHLFAPSDDTLSSAFSSLAHGEDTAALESPHGLRLKQEDRPWLLLSVVGGSLVLVAFAVILFLAFKRPGGGKPPGDEEDHTVIGVIPLQRTPAAVDDAWLKWIAAMPAEKQVEGVAKKLRILNPGFDGKMTHKIKEGVVTELQFWSDTVTNISPVKALMKLQKLDCAGEAGKPGTKLKDLSPLKGMPLRTLTCNWSGVADLSPLQGMSLTSFSCSNTKVSDLSPLKGMPLTYFNCANTQVADLSPLKAMPLTSLNCGGTNVVNLGLLKDMKLTSLACYETLLSDLSPLAGMPLHEIQCDFNVGRDAKILRSIKTLETINSRPAVEFWKAIEAEQSEKKPLAILKDPTFPTWMNRVATLPAEEQLAAVAKKLQELNPDFDGKVSDHLIQDGMVTRIAFTTDHVADISPVRALTGLKDLRCQGSEVGKGRLDDLSPLKGLQLQQLDMAKNKVHDLTPLKGMPIQNLLSYCTEVSDLSPITDMPLKQLHLACTEVADLSPLKGMKTLKQLYLEHARVRNLGALKGVPLQMLKCSYNRVTDLAALKGMPITSLDFEFTAVADLSPLRGMRLTWMRCTRSKVTDLSVIKNMPLKELFCDFDGERDTGILRSIKTLEKINGKPVGEFWKEVETIRRETPR